MPEPIQIHSLYESREAYLKAKQQAATIALMEAKTRVLGHPVRLFARTLQPITKGAR